MSSTVILRRAYKRAEPVILRRPYKRARDKDSAPVKPRDTRPKWFLDTLLAGEMRCPRKWSNLGLELCAQIQEESPNGCIAVRCHFYGTKAALLAEVNTCKRTGVAPKIGAPARSLTIIQGSA